MIHYARIFYVSLPVPKVTRQGSPRMAVNNDQYNAGVIVSGLIVLGIFYISTPVLQGKKVRIGCDFSRCSLLSKEFCLNY